MREIITGIVDKSAVVNGLLDLLSEIYERPTGNLSNILGFYFDKLKDDIYIHIEYPYVDKFYRNSYYTYFAKKHIEYYRDCIRLSLFNKKVSAKDFRNQKGLEKLQSSFLGFMVLRPTFPHIIGRSVISPHAFKDANFSCCLTQIQVLIDGVKLKVEGFPHCGQDTETISCAETTIWSVMEYFGHRYPEYSPTLPSNIIQALSKHTYERQLPSRGLRAEHISYALKEFGLGVRIYSRDATGHNLNRIFNYYVDSGIPVIVALQNDEVAHAVVFMGYENVERKEVENCAPSYIFNEGNLKIIDFADIFKNHIVIDDNFPPYQKASFSMPTEYYGNSNFAGCQAVGLIVPLYKRIHLEALNAKNLAIEVLKNNHIGWKNSNEIVFRLYLTSSNSYKSKAAINSTMDKWLKEMIINSATPKFIWVAEISEKQAFINEKANAVILIDATGTNANNLDSIILNAYPDVTYTHHNGQINQIRTELNPFDIFSNLQGGF